MKVVCILIPVILLLGWATVNIHPIGVLYILFHFGIVGYMISLVLNSLAIASFIVYSTSTTTERR